MQHARDVPDIMSVELACSYPPQSFEVVCPQLGNRKAFRRAFDVAAWRRVACRSVPTQWHAEPESYGALLASPPKHKTRRA